LRREIRSARSLKRKTYQRQVYRRGGIVSLLESFGVEDAWTAGCKIVSAGDNLTGPHLERLLLSFSYGTAHQAIQATTQLNRLQAAIQSYLDAEKDVVRAYELHWYLRDFQRAVERYIAVRRDVPRLTSLGLSESLTDYPSDERSEGLEIAVAA
jgi:hypothetical protein